MAVFNLPQLLNNIKHHQRRKAEKNALQLKFRNDQDLPQYLQGHPDVLAQILHGLINNAIKFTQKGYITIYSEVKTKIQEKIYLEFGISHPGVGVTKEKQHLVLNTHHPSGYENFASGTHNNSQQLSFLKDLIEQHSGTFHISNIPGEGNYFCFTLPFQLNHSNQGQGEEENQSFKLENLRDPNHSNGEFVKSMVDLFIQTTPELLGQMKQSLKEANYDEVARLAHQLKPSIDTLEITSQKERIRDIENLAKRQKNIETLKEMVEEFTTGLEKVMRQLNGI